MDLDGVALVVGAGTNDSKIARADFSHPYTMHGCLFFASQGAELAVKLLLLLLREEQAFWSAQT